MMTREQQIITDKGAMAVMRVPATCPDSRGVMLGMILDAYRQATPRDGMSAESYGAAIMARVRQIEASGGGRMGLA